MISDRARLCCELLCCENEAPAINDKNAVTIDEKVSLARMMVSKKPIKTEGYAFWEGPQMLARHLL